ncbi:hypothetical protein FACS189472_09640 [Alphaproteobacteria bacterium]|nr:hypothetical protein FACS189472_09640 [Alphaproteobacteria bacterium]
MDGCIAYYCGRGLGGQAREFKPRQSQDQGELARENQKLKTDIARLQRQLRDTETGKRVTSAQDLEREEESFAETERLKAENSRLHKLLRDSDKVQKENERLQEELRNVGAGDRIDLAKTAGYVCVVCMYGYSLNYVIFLLIAGKRTGPMQAWKRSVSDTKQISFV